MLNYINYLVTLVVLGVKIITLKRFYLAKNKEHPQFSINIHLTDLKEEKDTAKTNELSETIKDNLERFFKVPYETITKLTYEDLLSLGSKNYNEVPENTKPYSKELQIQGRFNN